MDLNFNHNENMKTKIFQLLKGDGQDRVGQILGQGNATVLNEALVFSCHINQTIAQYIQILKHTMCRIHKFSRSID
jgi:hypothetical protein